MDDWPYIRPKILGKLESGDWREYLEDMRYQKLCSYLMGIWQQHSEQK